MISILKKLLGLSSKPGVFRDDDGREFRFERGHRVYIDGGPPPTEKPFVGSGKTNPPPTPLPQAEAPLNRRQRREAARHIALAQHRIGQNETCVDCGCTTEAISKFSWSCRGPQPETERVRAKQPPAAAPVTPLAQEIPDDPVMSQMDAMMNGFANAIGYESTGGIRFIERNGRIIGIWVRAFPSNTTKSAFLRAFCSLKKQDDAHTLALLSHYTISKNTGPGGFDVHFNDGAPKQDPLDTNCRMCNKPLGPDGRRGAAVMSGSDLVSLMTERAVYACKSCGTPFCMGCMSELKANPCPACKKSLGW